MSRPVGIDLGTTYSAVAVIRDGRPEMVVNRDGGYLTPSVVLFQDDGEPLVGEAAGQAGIDLPLDCVQFVKRHMGDPDWSAVDASGHEYRAEQVSAWILRQLARDAATVLGEPVVDVVVTVPAYFDDLRRTATRQAGEIAGLNVLRLVNEPTAAAVAFGIARRQPGTYLVYDLGGGTFDVTILRAGSGEFEVLATDGDRNLGGFDFDNELMTLVAARIAEQGDGSDPLDDPVRAARLRHDCGLAKHRLSTMEQTVVVAAGGGRGIRIRITRDEFEARTRDLLERTEILAEGVLSDAGLSWDRVDQVLAVGGSTRMPMVQRMLTRLAGRPPVVGVNPDEAVALGAAVIADQVGAETTGVPSGLPEPVRVRDVTSQSLGTTVLVDKLTGKLANDILIERNTPIPCRVERIYGTVEADQRAVNVDINEGDSDDPRLVVTLIEREVALPPGLPEDAPLRHIMRYDADGRVHLSLIDESSGRDLGEVELDRPLNLRHDDVERMRRAMSDLERS